MIQHTSKKSFWEYRLIKKKKSSILWPQPQTNVLKCITTVFVLPFCWSVYWCSEECLDQCDWGSFLEERSRPLGRNTRLKCFLPSPSQPHFDPKETEKLRIKWLRQIMRNGWNDGISFTLSKLKILGDFLNASDFPNSSSLARVPSKWLLAHKPMPRATPCQTRKPNYLRSIYSNLVLFCQTYGKDSNQNVLLSCS